MLREKSSGATAWKQKQDKAEQQTQRNEWKEPNRKVRNNLA